jgi:very-short-patch-repair endonuclease
MRYWRLFNWNVRALATRHLPNYMRFAKRRVRLKSKRGSRPHERRSIPLPHHSSSRSRSPQCRSSSGRMTLPEFLVVLAVVFLMATFRQNLKKGKKPRATPKPIPRKGPLKRRAVWARNRPPTPETLAIARQYQTEQLIQNRNAQPIIAMCETLRQLGINFRQEEICWYDGSLFVLADFWLPDLKTTVEADGFQHRHQHISDSQKARMIRDNFGFRTLRYWNGEIMRYDFIDRLRRDLGITNDR